MMMLIIVKNYNESKEINEEKKNVSNDEKVYNSYLLPNIDFKILF